VFRPQGPTNMSFQLSDQRRPNGLDVVDLAVVVPTSANIRAGDLRRYGAGSVVVVWVSVGGIIGGSTTLAGLLRLGTRVSFKG
jgi:hypothetical protein